MQIILYEDNMGFDVIESIVIEGRIYTAERHLPRILEIYPDSNISSEIND